MASNTKKAIKSKAWIPRLEYSNGEFNPDTIHSLISVAGKITEFHITWSFSVHSGDTFFVSRAYSIHALDQNALDEYFLRIYILEGVHLERGPYQNRYSLPWAEAAPACAAIGETLASEQDLLDLQVSEILFVSLLDMWRYVLFVWYIAYK